MTLTPIINIKRGGKPVDASVIEAAKKAYMEARGWTDIMRDDAMIEPTLKQLGWIPETPAFMAAMQALSGFQNNLAHTIELNTFNAQLAQYRKAMARLNKHRLADGRPEIVEDIDTGTFDEDGTPVTEPIVTQTAVEALPETIMRDITDPLTGEVTGQEEVPNPPVVLDDQQRVEAQTVIDTTPQIVKDFDQ